MKRYRNILIVLVLLIALFQLYPTVGWMTLSAEEREARLARWKEEELTWEEPNLWQEIGRGLKRWSEFDREQVINLGLDLQGGVHMVVSIPDEPIEAMTPEELERIGFDEDAGAEDIKRYMQQLVLQRIKRRIAEFEAKEPVIQALGNDQIQVQLPGEKDEDRAKRLITRTAFLTFHLLPPDDRTEEIFARINEAFDGQFTPYLRYNNERGLLEFEADQIDRMRGIIEQAEERDAEALAAAENPDEVERLIPEDIEILFSPPPDPGEPQTYYIYAVEADHVMTGEKLQRAVALQNPNAVGNQWMISFTMSGAGAQQFGEVSGRHIGERLAIVVDGRVMSAPTIQERITQHGQITGQFTAMEAQDLAIALNSGSMPVPIEEEMTTTVGPTLGRASIEKGIVAAVVGLILVVVFMVAYYRAAGVIANLGLLCNAIIVVGSLAYFNATLTLPGIAGLILTIGMAVDANVLIFERIREELRNGRSLLASIESGFDRARVTILDANVTTLIAALVLMEIGTGPIEGFAVALIIGVCSSVFVALVITRAFFDWAANWGLIKTLYMSSWLPYETTIPFLNWRRYAAVGSVALILVGAGFFVARGKDNFGVEFTTGTRMIVHLEAEEDIDEDQVRVALERAGFDEPQVQIYEDPSLAERNRFQIRVGEATQRRTDVDFGARNVEEDAAVAEGETSADTDAAEGEDAGDAEAAAFEVGSEGGLMTVSERINLALAGIVNPADPETALQSVVTDGGTTIGPSVGRALMRNTIYAILLALVLIILYVWFRFELKFAVGSVVALLHDVLVTVGLFAIFGKELTLSVVAAILTIIGYSLNDTIVVFDRVREDLRLYRGRNMPLLEVMNISVNQTLRRTLLTSVTTLIVVIVLLTRGGEAIKDFAFALTVGVIIGTYSSIFVASPIAHLLEKHVGTRHVEGEVKRAADARPDYGKKKRARKGKASQAES